MTTPTEFKVAKESGFLLNRATGEMRPWDGVCIRWRFVGERRWRKRSIIADSEQGQTVASLKRNAAEIVAVLAASASVDSTSTARARADFCTSSCTSSGTQVGTRSGAGTGAGS